MGRHSGEEKDHQDSNLPLFETKRGKGRIVYRLFAASIFVGICLIWVYRAANIPKEGARRLFWIGLFGAELWFGFFWIITQSVRWNNIYRYPFKDRLLERYGNKLPCVDIFVCTADPTMEPPMLVIYTVLSVMAYDYPPEKLSVYLSDDGGSDLTFYAPLEASRFAAHWLPFCKIFNVEPRAPEKLYEEMKQRIKAKVKRGRISEELRKSHKGFSEWRSRVGKGNQQTILQILIDGRDRNAVDIEGYALPSLVYLAREPRPQHPHNFKAGAMNALIELAGIDGYGGSLYIGTGKVGTSLSELEEKSKALADCISEQNTQWGKEMGLKYGCPVEDVISGLTIQCRGWKSVYYSPDRTAFLGVAPITLDQSLVQHKRWSEGMFQIVFSSYCPFTYGYGKIRLGLQMGYCVYCLWAPNSFPVIYYVVVPPLCLLNDISLFPKVSSIWFVPFAYAFIANTVFSLVEALCCGDTLTGWWNLKRMWLMRRTKLQISQKKEQGNGFGLACLELNYGLVSSGSSHNQYGNKLPCVDIFVCTADPTMEPPMLVINTVLSVMAYDYPPEKLSVYLSDDGGSDLTFYALLEASRFAAHWLPFCKIFNVEPRAPEVYFAEKSKPRNDREWLTIKKLYEEMKQRIEAEVKRGTISEELRRSHKGFFEWSSRVRKGDHQTILQILIDGRNRNAVDIEGYALPSLVYLAREKRPQHPHNFKAGAMNALIRVSSEISNGQVILNVDCDMYSNDPKSLKDALCFLMDEESGHEIAFVQFPQNYNNLTPNDIYGNGSIVVNKIELAGIDGYGGSLYIGTGCFHRRESLSGKKYTKEFRGELNIDFDRKVGMSLSELEEKSKALADCISEQNTQWGKEMGLKYGCPVEDIISGLAIQCRGWKSIYYNPDKRAFLGIAPITLDQSLVQHKRWSEGMFQIAFSSYCPFTYGYGKIRLGLQMGYCVYCLWAPNSFPVIYYVVVPPLCLLNGISLFPKVSSIWFVPFAYAFIANTVFSLVEALYCGDTLTGWWNLKRMWLMRRTSSYLLSFIDSIVKKFGSFPTTFALTTKVVEDDVYKRYEQEILEFGSSPMFTIIATLALLNLFSLFGGLWRVFMGVGSVAMESLISQIVLCGLMVAINAPIYIATFFRKDKGRMSTSVTLMSVGLALLACVIPIY
ncbi:hypothetical protein GIB67_001045 [Kingdonia uniflora]|uniref:Cellulose synthase-like protein E6 n=1 Tax=Kingdonia uniflora TaxID=39325 RepID=A0A7J7MG72_9MAGN|nr:hypothetical protein GIB67_001045 [Kingdonia uniflora]